MRGAARIRTGGGGFLIPAELAERWAVSLAPAKAIVRDEHVPFISLRKVDMRINWSYVRFEPEVVAAWERSRQRVAAGPDPDAVQPTTVVHRILDGGRRRGKP